MCLSILPSLIYIPHSISYKYPWHIYHLVIITTNKFDKMPPKATQLLLVVTTLGHGNTSMAESLDINS